MLVPFNKIVMRSYLKGVQKDQLCKINSAEVIIKMSAKYENVSIASGARKIFA